MNPHAVRVTVQLFKASFSIFHTTVTPGEQQNIY